MYTLLMSPGCSSTTSVEPQRCSGCFGVVTDQNQNFMPFGFPSLDNHYIYLFMFFICGVLGGNHSLEHARPGLSHCEVLGSIFVMYLCVPVWERGGGAGAEVTTGCLPVCALYFKAGFHRS